MLPTSGLSDELVHAFATMSEEDAVAFVQAMVLELANGLVLIGQMHPGDRVVRDMRDRLVGKATSQLAGGMKMSRGEYVAELERWLEGIRGAIRFAKDPAVKNLFEQMVDPLIKPAKSSG